MQSRFSELEYAAKERQTRRDRFLYRNRSGNALGIADECQRAALSGGSGKLGRPAVGLERIPRMYFSQKCCGLSDEGVEDAVYDSQAIRRPH